MSIKNLGYLVVQSTDLSKWEDYGLNVLGMMKSTSMADNGSVYLKMDQRPFRYQVIEGPFDGLLYCGYDMGSEADFQSTVEALTSKGYALENITDEAVLAERAVSALARLADPSGNLMELYWTTDAQNDDGVAFQSGLDVKEFVTTADNGVDMGLGHVVLHCPTDFEGCHAFYQSLGLADADITNMDDKGLGQIYFMHSGPRHHSVAIWNWGGPSPETNFQPSPESKAPGCGHVMSEVRSLSEVGQCLDRVNEREIMVVSSLGEHINDEMYSFYHLTPGNFAMEFGYNGIQLDDSWETTHNTDASHWGHKWQG